MAKQADSSASPQKQRSPWIHRAVGLIGISLLSLHFIATALYLHPISVVGLGTYSSMVSYMEPYFHQRWTLFAPDPPLSNRWVDYQCEIDGEEQPWVSRTHALVDAHARSRFGPANRMRRLEQAAVMAIVGVKDSVLDELVEHKERGSEEHRELVEVRAARMAADRIVGGRRLYELVANYCHEDHGVEPQRVRFRMVTQDIAPFSYRNDASWTAEAQATQLPWMAPADFTDLEQEAKDYMLDFLRENGYETAQLESELEEGGA